MIKISNYLKQKGQGIVEYALLLAFVVGIAMMLNGTNLGGAVKGVFDDVAMVLSGGEEFDLSTAEGRKAADIATMKKLGEGLAKNFKITFNNPIDNNEKSSDAIAMQKNFVHVTVFSDGTVDAYIDGGSGTGDVFWLSSLSQDDERYQKYSQAFKNAGFDITNPEKATSSLGVKDTEGEWKNGYSVVFGAYNGEATVKYVSLPSSMESSARSTNAWATGTNIGTINKYANVKDITSSVQ